MMSDNTEIIRAIIKGRSSKSGINRFFPKVEGIALTGNLKVALRYIFICSKHDPADRPFRFK